MFVIGRTRRGPAPRYGPRSFDLESVTRVGNYALQPNWADEHSYGIWTYERLREVYRRDLDRVLQCVAEFIHVVGYGRE